MGRPLFSSFDSASYTDAVGVGTATETVLPPEYPLLSGSVLDTTTITPLPHNTEESEHPTSNLSPTTILDDLANSQASLLHATAVFNDTFARLRILRNRLANNMPSQNSAAATAASETGMNPGHSAIVLSDADRNPDRISTTLTELRSSPLWPQTESSQRPQVSQRQEELLRMMREVRDTRRRIEPLAARVGEASASLLPQTAQRSAVPNIQRFGPRPELAQSRRIVESYVRSQHIASPGDSSTTLGRRVAARAAANARTTDPDARRSALADDAASRLIEITSILRRDITLLAEHREEILRSPWASLSASDRGMRETASASSSGNRLAAEVARTRENHLRHQRSMRTGAPSGSVSNRRNAPSQPPTNASTDAPRQMQDTGVATQANPLLHEEIHSRPSYRVRRRLTADGEEHIQNIIMSDSDDDDLFSWFVPAAEREQRRRIPISHPLEETVNVAPSNLDGYSIRPTRRYLSEIIERGRAEASRAADNSRPRRRGWARLDRDGNEIPTDEEEEYERNRAQMRSRALALSSRQAVRRTELALAELPLPPPPPLSLQPTTQTLFWQSPGDSNVRVRLGPFPGTDMDGNVVPDSDDSATLREGPSQPRYFGSAVPFTPSPLPLPLVEVSSSVLQPKRPHVTGPVEGVRKRSQAWVAGR
ncbi:predicted protein [Sparassis crispa]|uniref:Uncharacterized protein n=1 Tax=Sparassis crispa TaxID=139825 RepID=A0A401G8M8_9APHY|nr:predicted protein [Sparassis crispa]GBE78512.1 predicted protein [Sparassis crispa]